jgi:hypothetical protein
MTSPLLSNFIARATLAQVRNSLPKSQSLTCSDIFRRFIAHIILATVMKLMDWLREAADTSTYVITFLLPTKNYVMEADAMPSKPMLLQLLGAPTINTIAETKTLACIALGLLVIFTVSYSRSPWRKLPPGGPWRIPILGNVLQLRDKSWMLSKDLKERFGESTSLYA